MTTETVTLVGIVATLIALIVKTITDNLQYYRTKRDTEEQRIRDRWEDDENRVRVAAEVVATADRVEREVSRRADAMAALFDTQNKLKIANDALAHRETLAAVADVHTSTREALHEANGAKVLIAALQKDVITAVQSNTDAVNRVHDDAVSSQTLEGAPLTRTPDTILTEVPIETKTS